MPWILRPYQATSPSSSVIHPENVIINPVLNNHHTKTTNVDFKKQKPIYLQIADSICERIMSGELPPDGRVPSVRDVAVDLCVNPNTVMRTFEYLQQNEIIFNRRGVGYFVEPKATERIIKLHRQSFIDDELPYFIQKMKMLGLTLKEVEEIITKENL